MILCKYYCGGDEDRIEDDANSIPRLTTATSSIQHHPISIIFNGKIDQVQNSLFAQLGNRRHLHHHLVQIDQSLEHQSCGNGSVLP
mmetsp:Transcript_32416/g.67051  ORF Transcript_32416/g.67051 Transcript_32416/m.67051 type:complete len:86 (+) Transcript_32416:34-291(+)